jgi:hypothetical protein
MPTKGFTIESSKKNSAMNGTTRGAKNIKKNHKAARARPGEGKTQQQEEDERAAEELRAQ